MPVSSKCTMHFRLSFTSSSYGPYFLPGHNFAPFEEMKVLASYSVDFVPKKCPLEDLGWIVPLSHTGPLSIDLFTFTLFYCVCTNSNEVPIPNVKATWSHQPLQIESRCLQTVTWDYNERSSITKMLNGLKSVPFRPIYKFTMVTFLTSTIEGGVCGFVTITVFVRVRLIVLKASIIKNW